MKLKKRIIVLGLSLIGLGCIPKTYAQQDPQYTQYMYNTNVINPAYVGSRESLNIFGMYRTQWVGLDGAPKTAAFSISTPLGESGWGLGVNFVNDRIGAIDENNIAIDLSYSIGLNRTYKLALGVKGTGNIMNVDYDKLNIYDPSDALLQNDASNKFNANVGAGLYLYSDHSYLGLSVPTMLQSTAYDDNEVTLMRKKQHFYLMGGYVFDLSDHLKLKPAFLAKAVEGAPLQVDVSANFLLYEKVTLGAAYRWDAAVSGLIGFQVSDHIFLGYSYDAETTALRNYNSGSHEIFLRFELFKRVSKITSPRFF
ncbi:type IX secretion system membrane protein PorP/SprF [Flavobacterium sp. HSC-61S13]|uniref:PorP/SprF family type IX secretion system membrane protein n=1 Tax=Flavobacterium sp. HSC-61S13 TaxID=2910963 RepID=UPI00209F17DD|nr:type IX secretion system membrane protein PorP/SprF [Flavobacterium sp. HSC-61S13]MCP1996489.1 type IX secretion system PorP/SprF family membrane protein [Flavobacterium sp. HSC-61S13]